MKWLAFANHSDGRRRRGNGLSQQMKWKEKRTSIPDKLLKNSDSKESAISELRARYTLAFPGGMLRF